MAAVLAAAGLAALALPASSRAATSSSPGTGLAVTPALVAPSPADAQPFTASWTAPAGSNYTLSLDGVTLASGTVNAGPASINVTPAIFGDSGSVTCGPNLVMLRTSPSMPGPGLALSIQLATLDGQCGETAVALKPASASYQRVPQTFQAIVSGFTTGIGAPTLYLDGQQLTTGSPDGPDYTMSFQAAPTCGTHFVMVTDPGDGPELTDSAGALLTIACTPAIVVAPAAIARTAQPTHLLVTGTQFYPGLPVNVTVGGQLLAAPVADGGVFRAVLTVPGLGCGVSEVTASQPGAPPADPPLSASQPLTVTGCRQQLRLDPAVLQPSELTLVTGSGFGAGQPVTLKWQLPGGGAMPQGGATVTASGSGAIRGYVMVMPGDVLGPRQLVATQAGTTATANALVQGGPMEPSSGDRLVYRGS